MLKKIIFLMMLSVPVLFAKGIFSHLPYNVKLGAPLPSKVEDKLAHKNFKYQVTGKFGIEWDKDSGILDSIYFSYGMFDIPSVLPRAWRVAGLQLCYENTDGTSYERVKELIRENAAYEVEESEDHYRRIINFKVDGNKQYELIFFKKAVKDDHGKGLAYITITRTDTNSFDDDY